MKYIFLCCMLILSMVSAGLLGGRNSIKLPPDEDVLGAAEFAGKHILKGGRVQIISGTQQVVAGML